MKLFAITTGDADGIGPEVTAKALAFGPFPQDIRFLIFRDPTSSKLFDPLGRRYRRHIVPSLQDALTLPRGENGIVEIVDGSPAPHWVGKAANACLSGTLSGMITAPLSKTLIRDSGLDDLGHTEILGRIAKRKHLFQAYLGRSFNVVLATAHMPLRQVPQAIESHVILKAIREADRLRRGMPAATRRKPLGVLSLNPHAGERGLIGAEERDLRRRLQMLRRDGISLEGPLVPDAAFAESNWKRYSIYVALYHDQGLIPFKMVHGHGSGVHLTLGLPFLRTSVDHGTAKDIAGRGIANPGSMVDAIQWCLRLARKGGRNA